MPYCLLGDYQVLKEFIASIFRVKELYNSDDTLEIFTVVRTSNVASLNISWDLGFGRVIMNDVSNG
jgi:hypothetical protein